MKNLAMQYVRIATGRYRILLEIKWLKNISANTFKYFRESVNLFPQIFLRFSANKFAFYGISPHFKRANQILPATRDASN